MGRELNFAFVTDPIKGFNPRAETTSFLAHECLRREIRCWFFELGDLCLKDGKVLGWGRRVLITKKNKNFVYRIVETREWEMESFACLWLRKDPPVDLTYHHHLDLLCLLKKPLMINDPRGIKTSNEKIYPFVFKNISPPTLVTGDGRRLGDFISLHKKTVVKPLNRSGGSGVKRMGPDLKGLKRSLRKLTGNFTTYVMAQKYLPEIKRGDKRILLFDGKSVGCFARVPKKGDFRGNLHAGARLVPARLSRRDRQIITQIRARLKKDGLLFVGIDVIGSFVTEINVTSPMGLNEINRTTGFEGEKMIISRVLKIIKGRDQRKNPRKNTPA